MQASRNMQRAHILRKAAATTRSANRSDGRADGWSLSYSTERASYHDVAEQLDSCRKKPHVCKAPTFLHIRSRCACWAPACILIGWRARSQQAPHPPIISRRASRSGRTVSWLGELSRLGKRPNFAHWTGRFVHVTRCEIRRTPPDCERPPGANWAVVTLL